MKRGTGLQYGEIQELQRSPILFLRFNKLFYMTKYKYTGSDKRLLSIYEPIDDLSNRMSVSEKNIQANANSITAEVSNRQAAIDGVQSDFSTYKKSTDGTIESMQNQIQSNSKGISAEVSNRQAAIDGIQVGGRNLLKNSADLPFIIVKESNWDAGIWRVAGTESTQTKRSVKEIADPPVGHDKVKCFAHTGIYSGVTTDISLYAIDSIPWNGDYTISFWGRVVGGGDNCFISVGDIGTVKSTNMRTERYAAYRKFPLDSKGAWKRLYISFNKVGSQTLYVGGANLGTTSKEIQICEIKIEKGTIPTAWTPAPEDVQAQIDNNATSITSLEKRIKALEDKLASSTSTSESNSTSTSEAQ